MTTLGFDYDSYYSDDSRELPIPAIFIMEREGVISFAKSMDDDYRNRVKIKEIINALK